MSQRAIYCKSKLFNSKAYCSTMAATANCRKAGKSDQMSGMPSTISKSAPLVGQHSNAVLDRLLGASAEQPAQVRRDRLKPAAYGCENISTSFSGNGCAPTRPCCGSTAVQTLVSAQSTASTP